jgi:predicted  nucleic acid-binding Zn-ribbon protein
MGSGPPHHRFLLCKQQGAFTMSEHNYAVIFFKDNLEKRPQDFTINEQQLSKQIASTIKASQELHAKNDAMKDGRHELRKEYNRLLNDHFDLKQWVRSCENRVNESAGQIRNHETRLTLLLEQKKTMESPLGLRTLEVQLVRLEEELAHEKEHYERLKKENREAVNRLKGFNLQRIADLKKELDTPPPKS